MEKYAGPGTYDCKADPNCIAANIPLLGNIRTGPIDPDTPKSAMTRKSADGVTQKLVVGRMGDYCTNLTECLKFSDEFNTAGRSFYEGDDPYFQAVDLWYGVTQDLEVRQGDSIIRAGSQD